MTCAFVLLGNSACSPALNWREVRPEQTRLKLLLPCKPDRAQKVVPLGGPATPLHMLGCDAGGVTFAVAVADLGPSADAAAVLKQWQNLALVNMKAPLPSPDQSATQITALSIKGAAKYPAPWRVSARGQRADGRAVMGEAAYFSHGTQIFQAVVYADQISSDVKETFFASLQFE